MSDVPSSGHAGAYQWEFTPAAVADVTGDGRPDLIVVQGDSVAVVPGSGSNTKSGTVRFDEIASLPGTWLSPPKQIPVNRYGDTDQLPRGKVGGTIVPLWDITGDGVNDFALNQKTNDRSGGASLYYAGNRCET